MIERMGDSMKFWKEHVSLRIALIIAFFVIGLTLIIVGWKQTGSLAGLGIMLVGLVLLLSALLIYNQGFEDSKSNNGR